MSEARRTAALAYGDALIGVTRRHLDRARFGAIDRWLLEELEVLRDLARRVGEGDAFPPQSPAALEALDLRLASLRGALHPLETLRPPVLVSLFGMQRRWHQFTLSGRARATRRPGQIERLVRASDAILHEAETRFPTPSQAPVLHERLPHMRTLRDRMARDLDRVRSQRERATRPGLAAVLRSALRPLEREGRLLIGHAERSEEARVAAGRWLDRAFELETQWLLFAAAAPVDRPWLSWHLLQRLSRRVRERLVLPSSSAASAPPTLP